ncbi:dTDP-4-dehydrorhamnose reductase [Phycisphaeraceae bacterium D3-23]
MPSQKNILLIAPNGMLGRAWRELLDDKGDGPRFASRPDFDITDPVSIRKHVTGDINIVINCCAYTDVDGAEEHEGRATAVNGHGVGDLANACRDAGALLVHYSTDYVFSGDATEPYPIDAPIEPINAYGRSKAVGERLIRESGCEHLILRTSWLYAPWGKNFVNTIKEAAIKRDALKVVDDQRGRPTSCQHLAANSLMLIEANARGTFHTTDGGECTWYDFAKVIAAHANPACTVNPCTSAEYPLPAKRPGYSVFDLSKTEALVGGMAGWEANLKAVLT